MPLCKKCGTRFAIMQTIDGKRRNLCKRRYCLTCSPFGGRNTRDLTGNDKKFGIAEGTKLNCATCGREYTVQRSKNHRPKQCASCATGSRRVLTKKKCVAYKGGACQRCGYSRCIAALEFHHVDENSKQFTIASAWNRAWEVVKAELDKCVMLCGNCHAEVHFTGENVSHLLCAVNSAARVSALQAESPGFESLPAHQWSISSLGRARGR